MGRACLPGFSYRSLRGIREENLQPQEYVFAAFTAVHLGEWYRRKRYCGACGALLDHDGRERAMRCPSCQEVFYPRINPAVIVGVIDHDNLLITRYLRGYGHNALVAGFTEVGETLEETVAREVMEETGLRVKNIRYYKSQPWGIASDLLVGFFCDVDGDTQVKLDGQELKSAVWTPRGEVTWQPPDYSLTSDMMKAFHEGRV
jgi:NAD+ diphosphatase